METLSDFSAKSIYLNQLYLITHTAALCPKLSPRDYLKSLSLNVMFYYCVTHRELPENYCCCCSLGSPGRRQPPSLFSSMTWQWGQGPELTHPGLTYWTLFVYETGVQTCPWLAVTLLSYMYLDFPSLQFTAQIPSWFFTLVTSPHQWDINSESVCVFTVESITIQMARLGFCPHKIRLYI